MATEICAACNTITVSMLVNGFEHPLDYHQILESKNHCQFCALVANSYDTQICAKHVKACDRIHHGRMIWRASPTGPGLRRGMFTLDSYHSSRSLSICVSEGTQ